MNVRRHERQRQERQERRQIQSTTGTPGWVDGKGAAVPCREIGCESKVPGLIRWSLLILACVVATNVLAAPTLAQFANADLEGRVLDQSGDALPGVVVTATSRSTGLERTIVTGADGTYVIKALRPGAYDVTLASTASRPGVKRESTCSSVRRLVCP